MYKIYINDIALIISDSVPEYTNNYQQIEKQGFGFLAFYHKIKNNKTQINYLLRSPSPKKMFKIIKKSLKLIEAGGGLVRNEENKYLFIYRKGKWDLPKGKLDEGEKTKTAAVREVEEECGITVSKLGEKICKTWHVYEMGGKVILKKTSWYHMKAINQPDLVPQLEEDITEARWVAPGEFTMIKQNTYPLISDLISVAEA